MIKINGSPAYVYYVGLTFTVEWYMDVRGRMNAKSCYDQLDETNQMRLDELVRYICDRPFGTQLPKNLYNEEDSNNKIYAFKPNAYRFFNFFSVNRKIIIVEAYRKHSQAMTKKDLNLLRTVIRAKDDYQNSVKAGGYYERIPQP